MPNSRDILPLIAAHNALAKERASLPTKMDTAPLPEISPNDELPPGGQSRNAQATRFGNDVPGSASRAELPSPALREGWTLSLSMGLSICSCLSLVPLAALGSTNSGRSDDWRIGFAFGFGFGIVSLAALWAVFGPFRFFTRVPLALLMVAASSLALAAFFLVTPVPRRDAELALLAAISAALQWLGLVFLFVAARAATGQVLTLPGKVPSERYRRAQFGIRQILLWTTGVAIFLAILRVVLSRFLPEGIDFSSIRRDGMVFGLLLVFNCAVTSAMAWGALSRGVLFVRLALALGAVILITLLEYPVFRTFLGPGDSAVFWWINGAGALCLGVNLLIVRLCGYRLVPDLRMRMIP